MNLVNKKLFIGAFILLAYIGIGVFGLFNFTHSVEMPMVNCPYVDGGSSVCDNSLAHINNWQQFSNVIVPAFFLLTFLVLGIALYFLFTRNFFKNLLRLSYVWRFYIKKKISHISLRKITRYLSLFENSPSFAFKA